jgi:MurNAc alpha-1-phosphate uridylyltransferase
VRALPLLGSDPFVVVSGDIVTDFDYSILAAAAARLAAGVADAHLVLVDNPAFHARGDMGLVDGLIAPDASKRYTYANVGVFAPRLFAGLEPVRARLFPWLYAAARAGRVTGQHFAGRWYNVGTPAELARLDAELGSGAGEGAGS